MAPTAAGPQTLLAKLAQMIQQGSKQAIQQGQSGGPPSGPNAQPLLSPARIPNAPQPMGQAPGTAPGQTPQTRPPQPQQAQQQASPYNIQNTPRASVGNFTPPTPQPITEVNSLEQLLMGWQSRKQQRKQAEASNAAGELMQAIEGAKQSGDWVPAYTILEHNEQLFNKVYKGWLQKADQQKKQQATAQAGASKKPDPEVQGFEQGVSQHLSRKQKQGAMTNTQAPAPGSAPTQLGGYFLPQASPQQKLQQQITGAQGQVAEQDPASLIGGPMTPERMAAQEKMQYELDVKRTELNKAGVELQSAQTTAQRADSLYKAALVKQLTSSKADEAKLQETLAKTAQDRILNAGRLDIVKANLGVKQQELQNLKQTGANIKARGQLQAGQQANWIAKGKVVDGLMDELQKAETDKKGWGDINTTDIAQRLRAAGAGSLASTIPMNWQDRLPWSKKSSFKDVIDALSNYKEQVIAPRLSGAQSKSADTSTPIVVDPKEIPEIDGGSISESDLDDERE